MTPKQTELWKLADSTIRMVGLHSIMRSPNAPTEGTKEWALLEAWGGARGQMPDDATCQKLIDCITK